MRARGEEFLQITSPWVGVRLVATQQPEEQMMKSLTRIFIFLFISSLAAYSGTPSKAQDYNDVGTVSGHVEIQDHPSLGRTPCRNCEFLLQRFDCRRCLIEVKTDGNGDYFARIGLGKWRILMTERREGSAKSIDLLSPEQIRIFEVKSPMGRLVFDVKTITPP
jgi:hypothetical protein